MKQKFVHYMRLWFPFLLTVGLWRLSSPFWNPAGVLAIIPIFFCTFVKPVNWFLLFSVLMCVALDYKFETVCLWLAMYCLVYSINAFQNWIDIKRIDSNALIAFMVFFGISVIILVVSNMTFVNLGRGIWMFVWGCAMYLPITQLIKKVHHD